MLLFDRLFRRKKRTSAQAQMPEAASIKPKTTWLDNRARLDDAPYLLPKDLLEDNRLNYQHHVLHFAIGSHYVAPLPRTLHHILDVGTGTGIWVGEMARQYPQAHVVGVDIAATSFKQDQPFNCSLMIGNVLERLPFSDKTFDYTHQRFLVSAIPAARWPDVIRELVRVTTPGGWIELLEINNAFQNPGPQTRSLSDWIVSVSKAMGFDENAVPSIGRWLTEAGVELVEQQDIVVPLGDWGGRAGGLLKRDLLAGFDAAKAVYCARTQTPVDVFDNMLQTVAQEWENYHTSYTFHAFYGRRAN